MTTEGVETLETKRAFSQTRTHAFSLTNQLRSIQIEAGASAQAQPEGKCQKILKMTCPILFAFGAALTWQVILSLPMKLHMDSSIPTPP